MDNLKNDRKRLDEFLRSNENKIEFEYSNCDNLHLKYFCRILNNSWAQQISKIIFILHHYLVYSFIKKKLFRMFGVKIGKNTYIGPFVKFDPYFPNLIEIGENVIIAISAGITTHEISRGKLTIGRIKIGNNVIIGAESLIKAGVTIGDNAEIAMGAVVFRDVPAGCTAIGNPARIITGSGYKPRNHSS